MESISIKIIELMESPKSQEEIRKQNDNSFLGSSILVKKEINESNIFDASCSIIQHYNQSNVEKKFVSSKKVVKKSSFSSQDALNEKNNIKVDKDYSSFIKIKNTQNNSNVKKKMEETNSLIVEVKTDETAKYIDISSLDTLVHEEEDLPLTIFKDKYGNFLVPRDEFERNAA